MDVVGGKRRWFQRVTVTGHAAKRYARRIEMMGDAADRLRGRAIKRRLTKVCNLVVNGHLELVAGSPDDGLYRINGHLIIGGKVENGCLVVRTVLGSSDMDAGWLNPEAYLHWHRQAGGRRQRRAG